MRWPHHHWSDGYVITNHNSRQRNAASLNPGNRLPHSGPGLIEPTLPPTADRKSEACTSAQRGAILHPAAYHQHKNGQGLGRSPIGPEGTVPSSLSCFINKRLIVTDENCTSVGWESESDTDTFEKLQAHIDDHDKRGKKKGCGAWTACGHSVDGRKVHFNRLNCKCWDCRYCGPRRARRYRRAIAEWAGKLGLNRFLTLTLDPKKLNGEDSTKYLKRCFQKLRSLLHRKYGKALTYVCVLEYQKNGNAHLHILLNQRIEIDWLKKKWQAVGGGWNVWITMVTIRRVVNYVSKYFSKELLMSAPKRSRRVTTSRDIYLFEKPSKDVIWSLRRVPIDRLRKIYIDVEGITETFCETAGSLTSFCVVANIV